MGGIEGGEVKNFLTSYTFYSRIGIELGTPSCTSAKHVFLLCILYTVFRFFWTPHRAFVSAEDAWVWNKKIVTKFTIVDCCKQNKKKLIIKNRNIRNDLSHKHQD